MKNYIKKHLKNSLPRLKKLLLTKEAILILTALLLAAGFALTRGGGRTEPFAQQNSGIPSMRENTIMSSSPSPMAESPPEPPEPEPPEPEPEPSPEFEPPANLDIPGAAPPVVSSSDAPPPSPGAALPELSEQPPDIQPEAPADTAPVVTETSVEPSEVLPGATPNGTSYEPPTEPAEPTEPTMPPIINFTYIWSGSAFKPCADIAWTAETAVRIQWQLCSETGHVLLEGDIPANGGAAARLIGYTFDTSAQSQNGLYPMGYVLMLIPYDSAGALTPHIMELPYFEVSAQGVRGALQPVIATNIGRYFVHAFENLTATETDGKLRIRGSLLPQEGPQTSLEIDMFSK